MRPAALSSCPACGASPLSPRNLRPFFIPSAGRPRPCALTLNPLWLACDFPASYSVAGCALAAFLASHCGACPLFPSLRGSCFRWSRSPRHAKQRTRAECPNFRRSGVAGASCLQHTRFEKAHTENKEYRIIIVCRLFGHDWRCVTALRSYVLRVIVHINAQSGVSEQLTDYLWHE